MPTPKQTYQLAIANLGRYINGPNDEKLDVFTTATTIAIGFGKDKADVMYDIVDVARRENSLPPTVRLIKPDIQVDDIVGLTDDSGSTLITGKVTMLNQAKGEPVQAIYINIHAYGNATFIPVGDRWQRTSTGTLYDIRVITSSKDP